MALQVEALNGDTSFLFAFAPAFAPKKKTARKLPGAFTILIDPWLRGSSSILHPKFQISHHTSTCAISSLADLGEQPDLIIISQDKPDHCHKETLCSMPADWTPNILATPAAAKKIQSWKHFDPSSIQVMEPYQPDKLGTLFKVTLPSYTRSSAPGEITIANIPTKHDLTGLHNAIGLTYRPPASLLTALQGGRAVNLQDVIGLATSPKVRKAKSTGRLRKQPSLRAPPMPEIIVHHADTLPSLGRTKSLPTRPASPQGQAKKLRRVESGLQRLPPLHSRVENTLSVLYTPHGISPSALQPYLAHHLAPAGALPLTALFHSINTEENPWFLGGKVAHGAPGGVKLANNMAAKHWVGAHDEVKDNRGLATVWIRSRRYSVDDVEVMLREARRDGATGRTEVHMLGAGDDLRIDLQTDAEKYTA